MSNEYFYQITKFEKTAILGTRATQISKGAPSTIDVGNMTDPIEIAKKEYENYKIPLILERNMPDKKVVKIPLYDNKKFYSKL